MCVCVEGGGGGVRAFSFHTLIFFKCFLMLYTCIVEYIFIF